MRKLIMWNIITLDGYFEGDKNWDLPFHEVVWGSDLEKFCIDQLKVTECLVFGRVTYEGMAAHWRTADGEIADYMNELPKFVFSKTLQSVDWNNSTLLNGEAHTELLNVKAQGNGNMFVFGSANLSETLIQENLFDEYRIGIAPVILGSGRPLFRQGVIKKKLKFVSSQHVDTGGIIATYIPD